MIHATQNCFLSVAYFEEGSRFLVSQELLCAGKKGLSVGWFCLVCGQQRRHGGAHSAWPLQCFRVFCLRTEGLGCRLQHRPSSPHSFPFLVLVEGEALRPLSLEDLQTDNGEQTALENITSLEQPQGWAQGLEKGLLSWFPSALHPEQRQTHNTKISSLWIKTPLQENMQMAQRPLFEPVLTEVSFFLCLAPPADPALPDWRPAFQFCIFDTSDSQTPGLPATSSKRGSFSPN